MSFDKDAVYIDIGRVNYTKKDDLAQGDQAGIIEPEYDPDEPAGMLKGLQDVDDGVDEKIKHSTLRLFKGSKAVPAESDDEEERETKKNGVKEYIFWGEA